MTATIIPGNTSLSDYNVRTVAIEVTGMCRQDVAKKSSYVLKVPYNSMSQTIQNISRMGGKVAKVTLVPSHAPVPSPVNVATVATKAQGNDKHKSPLRLRKS